MYFSAPLRAARICSYSPESFHCFSRTGSFWGRLAFIGNFVSGRVRVALSSSFFAGVSESRAVSDPDSGAADVVSFVVIMNEAKLHCNCSIEFFFDSVTSPRAARLYPSGGLCSLFRFACVQPEIRFLTVSDEIRQDKQARSRP